MKLRDIVCIGSMCKVYPQHVIIRGRSRNVEGGGT